MLRQDFGKNVATEIWERAENHCYDDNLGTAGYYPNGIFTDCVRI